MSTAHPPIPRRSTYAGLFIVTFATLLLELGLTRLFSVIMYYHMAFFAVSVTLFGLAFGGAIVHFRARWFSEDRVPAAMSLSSIIFGLSMAAVLALLIHMEYELTRNRVLVPQLLLTGLALAVPFTAGGVVVALALTKYPRQTNLLYGWDLGGAALGCLLFAPLITALGGPRFILLTALLMAGAGVIFALGMVTGASRGLRAAGWISTVLLAVLMVAGPTTPLYRLDRVRGGNFAPEALVYDQWNSISRITGFEQHGNSAGVSPGLHGETGTDQITLLIDTFAATQLVKLGSEADAARLLYPFHDVSYAVHAVVKDARVAVIGVGGGRDIVAARAWGQPSITGIEINGRTLQALRKNFAEYSGGLATWPGVTLVQDEARSYLARAGERYDIIQASLIDTFAATSAGAFVLTENSLYTLEGWDVFLGRLTERGVLTMTRWYNEQNPLESIRLLVLARAALERNGITNPAQHLLMVRTPPPVDPNAQPLATLLVKKTPFTPAEIDAFEKFTSENQLLPLVSPRGVSEPLLAEILAAPKLDDYVRAHPFNISPPTDDCPFFFNVLRWGSILRPEYRQGSDYMFSINLKPIVMLGTLLATVTLLALVFIIVPFVIENRRNPELAHWPLGERLGSIVYFMMLGFGYLMIELVMMQRLTLVLGHPGYSLTVCLFTMLLASGLGSMTAPAFGRWVGRRMPARGTEGTHVVAWAAGLAFVVQLLTLAGLLWVVHVFEPASTPVRILVAGLLIAPAGFLMGMPLPLGIQTVARKPGAPLAWYWGVNGVCSVCASVLVVVLGHTTGLTGAFLAGAGCYAVAMLVAPTLGTRSR